MVKRLSSTDQNSRPITNVPTPVNPGDAVNKSYVDAGFGSNSFVFNAAVTGTKNGTNKAFTSPDSYVSATLEVFLNGVLQEPTTDYAETTPASGIFTFVVAPLSTDTIRVCYQHSTGTTGNADTVDSFHAASTPTANKIPVLDGNAQMPASTVNITTSEAILGATFNITGVNNTYQDTGFSITLPSAGKYEIEANVRGDIQTSSGTGWLSCKLFDSTNSIDVPSSHRMIISNQVVNVVATSTVPIHTFYTVTGSTVIKLYAARHNATTYTSSSIVSTSTSANGPGVTNLIYKKVG